MKGVAEAAALRQLVTDLQQTERLTAGEISQLQSRTLAALVAHHARHTPAFAARLKRAKLQPGDVHSVDTLQHLPLLTRRDIQNLGSNFYCNQLPADHLPVGTTMTSGSTGEPVKVRKSAVCQRYWGANTAREHRWNQRDVTARLVSIRPTITTASESKSWGFPMSALGPTGSALGLPTSMDLGEHVRRIDEFQPQTLLVFPNLLNGLLDEWERRGHAPPTIRHFKTVGETVREELRERVHRLCGVAIEDSYSSQECGIIAMQCPAGGMYHAMVESVLVEVLDDAGLPCNAGEAGRLVVTELRNFASPLIRYEIGDIAVRGGPCACGLPFPTLQRVLGRDRHLLVRPDGSRRYPIVGFHEFYRVAAVRQFRFIQHSLEDIELIVHTAGNLDTEQRAGLAVIAQTALEYPHPVRVTHSATPLPRSASGKFEDFVSRVAADQTAVRGRTDVK